MNMKIRYLKSKKKNKFASEPSLVVSESNELYIYENNEVVPKEDGIISSLPTINPAFGDTYIKAKE